MQQTEEKVHEHQRLENLPVVVFPILWRNKDTYEALFDDVQIQLLHALENNFIHVPAEIEIILLERGFHLDMG